MSFFDPHKPSSAVSFVHDHLGLSPEHDRASYEKLMTELKIREHALTAPQLDLIKNFAVAVWPARQIGRPIEEARIALAAIRLRLQELREQAMRADAAQQDLLLSKLATLEDRIYFGGETISLEALDEELRFDRSDAEVPPADEPML